MRPLPLLLGLLSNNAHAENPPGTWFDPAVTVDVSADGINNLVPLVSSLLPESIALPEVRLSGEEEECVDLIFDDLCWNWYEWDLHVWNLAALISIDDFNMRLGHGEMFIDMVIGAGVSSAGDPGRIDMDLEVVEIIDIDQDCRLWVDPIPLGINTRLTMGLVWPPGGGTPGIDIGLSPIDIDLSIQGIHMDGCFLADVFNFVLDVNDLTTSILNFDIFETVSDLLEPAIENLLNDQLPQIEADLNESLAALTIATELDVAEIPLKINMEPSRLQLHPQGIRFDLSGDIGAGPVPDPCIRKYGYRGSLHTPGAPWDIGEWPRPVALAVQVEDDFINQALFTFWWKGLLCQEITNDGSIELPIPLDTTLVKLLSGDSFQDLFPDDNTSDISIITRPRTPPVLTMDGSHDMDINVNDLGLDLYAELDGRMTRVVGYAMRANVGVDLDLDPATGVLGVGVPLGEDSIRTRVGYNDLRPSANVALEEGLGGLINNFAPTVIDGLLGDLSFPLPTTEGIGLSIFDIMAAGYTLDQLGLEAQMGYVAYDNPMEEGAGLLDGLTGGGGGCGGDTADTGGAACSSAPPTGWLTLLLPAVALVTRRRRR